MSNSNHGMGLLYFMDHRSMDYGSHDLHVQLYGTTRL